MGNDPRLNPPPEGEVTATQTSSRGVRQGLMHRPAMVMRNKRDGESSSPNIVLQGSSVLDHLTLRDIL